MAQAKVHRLGLGDDDPFTNINNRTVLLSNVHRQLLAFQMENLTNKADDIDTLMLNSVFSDWNRCEAHGVFYYSNDNGPTRLECDMCPVNPMLPYKSSLSQEDMPFLSSIGGLNSIRKMWLDAFQARKLATAGVPRGKKFDPYELRLAREAQAMEASSLSLSAEASSSSSVSPVAYYMREAAAWWRYMLTVHDWVRPQVINKFDQFVGKDMSDKQIDEEAPNLKIFQAYLEQWAQDASDRNNTRNACWCFAHKRMGHLIPVLGVGGYAIECWRCPIRTSEDYQPAQRALPQTLVSNRSGTDAHLDFH